eukprot:g31142.t1
MELQHLQRPAIAAQTPRSSVSKVLGKRKAPSATSPIKTRPLKGISMIKGQDGQVRYFARAIISGIAISSRCVRTLQEAQALRETLNQVSSLRSATSGHGCPSLEMAFSCSEEPVDDDRGE